MAHAAPDHAVTLPARPGGRLRRTLRSVYLFEWLALLSLAALLLLAWLGPVRPQFLLLGALTLRRLLIVALLGVALATVVALARGARRDGLRATWRRLEWRRPRLWLDAARIVVACSIVESSHLLLKVYIPVLTSANHDALLARLDAGLLGRAGVAGLAGALARFPALLQGIDLVYSGLYYLVLASGLVGFFALLGRGDRIRFFSSFCLMWQVGLLLYILLPSWGPVFVAPGGFAKALQHMPLTVTVQHQLYLETSAIVRRHYDTVIRFFGLAAFPSLHVAVIFLYTLWARRSRPWFAILLALTTLMLLGSMVTGYHYLVDGLAGLLVGAFAFVVGRRWPVGGVAGTG